MNWDPTPQDLLFLILTAPTNFSTACFDRTFPTIRAIRRNSIETKYVASSQVGLPIVCDVNDSTWLFRIGFEDQDDNDEHE